MSDMHSMSNEEWLAAVLACDKDSAAMDFIYDSIDDAHDAPDAPERIDALLAWLDPARLPTVCIIGVLSISRRPISHLLPMAAAIGRGEDGPPPVSFAGLDAFARRAVAVVREREPARDVPRLLHSLVDDALLAEVLP